jgi:hypothetical protein
MFKSVCLSLPLAAGKVESTDNVLIVPNLPALSSTGGAGRFVGIFCRRTGDSFRLEISSKTTLHFITYAAAIKSEKVVTQDQFLCVEKTLMLYSTRARRKMREFT